MSDDQPMKTPDSEMMEHDLNHYEHLSTECCSSSSSVPDAIKFYWKNQDKIKDLEHFMQCSRCSDYFDMRNLSRVCFHMECERIGPFKQGEKIS